MSHSISLSYRVFLVLVIGLILGNHGASAQETNTNLTSSSTYHNQLYFNRYLINPTFSLVRENKSYLNILHRNQYATFNDNSQNYYLGFSNKLNERTALGIGVYSQWQGIIQEFGFNANYASAVKLGEKSALTFGANVIYYNEGVDKNRVVASENDPVIADSGKESKLAIQPGINLTVGKFDFGLYALDLFKYNQTTNEFLTRLDAKSVKASVQFTQELMGNGLFRNARLMPLVQVGRNQDNSIGYLGSLLLDMPKFGWFQASWDDNYGLSTGLGFSLNSTMSLGYVMEKDVLTTDADFGWNHELSLAYTFKNVSTEKKTYSAGTTDSKIDGIVRNYEEQIKQLLAEREDNKRKTKSNVSEVVKTDDDINTLVLENRLILDELILRQDSIELARNSEFEKRFETIVRILRNDIKSNIATTMEEFAKPQNSYIVENEKKNEKFKPFSTAAQEETHVEVPIKVLNQADMEGVKTGYYVIANVFKNKSYLNAFVNKLNDKGIKAHHFYNKANGLYYVYLADYNFRKDAEMAFSSNLNGKYSEEKWIMQVDNPNAIVNNTYEDENGIARRNY